MVLHTRGRVGRRQLFYKPLSTDLLREAFFCFSFWGARPYLNWGYRVLTWGRRVSYSQVLDRLTNNINIRLMKINVQANSQG